MRLGGFRQSDKGLGQRLVEDFQQAGYTVKVLDSSPSCFACELFVGNGSPNFQIARGGREIEEVIKELRDHRPLDEIGKERRGRFFPHPSEEFRALHSLRV